MMKSKTLSISIKADPKKVYAFASNLENLPKLAKAFCRSIKKAEGDWIIESAQGPLKVRITPPNPFGILDHTVLPPGAPEVFVPMRVVANDEGSEVFFTLFRRPEMTDVQYAEDERLVGLDLAGLKTAMEK